MKTLPRAFVILLLACVAGSHAARGQTVIYDNLSNGNNCVFGVGATTWRGQRFNTDATNLFLTGESLLLANNGLGSGTIFLSLYSDTAGLPGTMLATLFSGPAP